MEDLLAKEVKKLSGGQKRRLAFLSSLVGSTKVVLIDEAMKGTVKTLGSYIHTYIHPFMNLFIHHSTFDVAHTTVLIPRQCKIRLEWDDSARKPTTTQTSNMYHIFMESYWNIKHEKKMSKISLLFIYHT